MIHCDQLVIDCANGICRAKCVGVLPEIILTIGVIVEVAILLVLLNKEGENEKQ